MQQRRRFKQTLSLSDRLAAFAKKLRHDAEHKTGAEQEDLLQRADQCDSATVLERYIKAKELEPPK